MLSFAFRLVVTAFAFSLCSSWLLASERADQQRAQKIQQIR